MENYHIIKILVFFIIILSMAASSVGIFSSAGPGEYEFTSVHGQSVTIHGKGVYQHMSWDVAVQGIAQDYVTLFIGIPLLVISLYLTGKGSMKGRYLLAGTTGYFLVTYLFYMLIGMYNVLFLVYVFLLGLSFFAFLLIVLSFDLKNTSAYFTERLPVRFLGGFLIFNSIAVGLMWLGVVVPPLLDGTIYPDSLQHYTTLVVQGLDLGLLLPAAFVSGVLFLKRNPYGYLFAPVYLIFLMILMTALTAKIIGIMSIGADAGPAIIIIPVINLVTIISVILILTNVKQNRAI
jgi:hypothetical protein